MRGWDLEVLQAEGVRSALSLLSRCPDLLLLDLRLPDQPDPPVEPV